MPPRGAAILGAVLVGVFSGYYIWKAVSVWVCGCVWGVVVAHGVRVAAGEALCEAEDDGEARWWQVGA